MNIFPHLVRSYETHWKRRNTFRYLDQLRRSQYQSPDAQAAQRLGRLRDLLQHASTHTAFYARTLRDLGGSPRTYAPSPTSAPFLR